LTRKKDKERCSRKKKTKKRTPTTMTHPDKNKPTNNDRTPRNRGGLGFMNIPILADLTKEIAARYGVLLESAGIALRGLFLINPEGVVQHITFNDLPIGA